MSVPSLPRALAAALILAAATSAAAQTRPAPPREETDAEKTAGHWGLAFFGLRSYDFTTGGNVPSRVDVYTFGARRWSSANSGGLGKGWGIEGGLGLAFGNDKQEQPQPGGTLVANASAFGFGLHLGLPLALAQGKHVTVLLLPETNLVLVTSTNDLPQKTDWKGFGLDLGVRAGVELRLGFIGVPQVSLEGSLGLGLHYDSTSSKAGNAAAASNSRWRLGTDAARGLLAGNLSAIYYL